jgi:ADP-ribose pyrophosphatase
MSHTDQPNFTIRVYGIWIDEQKQILLSDEKIGDFYFTKFPGGGLEYGEGILDCLHREWEEELGCNIMIQSHYYTTEFFQASAFHKKTQVISVYYLVEPITEVTKRIQRMPFDFMNPTLYEAQSLRKKKLSELTTADVTLPIDKVVAEKLILDFG